jgi:hypothetical protein
MKLHSNYKFMYDSSNCLEEMVVFFKQETMQKVQTMHSFLD